MANLKNLFHEEVNRVMPARFKPRRKNPRVEEYVGAGDWSMVPLYISLIAVVFVLFTKSFYLQVIRGEENRIASDNNSLRRSVIRAERGVIFDRKGKILVRNKPGFSVELNHTECLPRCREVVEEVSKLIHIDKVRALDQLDKRLTQITLASKIERDELIKVESRLSNLPGVTTQVDPVRDYLLSSGAAHLIGYIGEGEREEREGKSGLEKVYERYLHGVAGSAIIQVNSLGTYFTQIAKKDPIPGKNLHLYLDLDLQRASFEALKEAVLLKKAVGGAVVASDPSDGSVLALASYPSFDPNLFATGLSSSDLQNLVTDSGKPFFNRAVSALYPPGSTFKMVTALAALSSGVITADTKVDCPPFISVRGFVFRDWYSGGRGLIDVRRALQVSCDTFFYAVSGGYGNQVGVGIDQISEVAGKAGIGKMSGIDLDGEVFSTFPDPGWKKDVRGEDWYLGDTYIASIGQGDILMTPLQLNLMTSFFASGGRVYKPRIVRSIEGEKEYKPELLVSEESYRKNIDVIREGMRLAVLPGGTAYPLFDFEKKHPGIALAGKTGTAEFGNPVEEGEDTHAWFTVFGPFEDPNIVLTVLLEGGGSGADDAAPVARKILDEWFK